MSVLIRGTSLSADTQRGALVPGARLAWSVSSGLFKAALIVAEPDAVDEQLSVMGDWFETEVHEDLAFAETMMADRAECLRGKPVRYRGQQVRGQGSPVKGLALLARFDEVLPGDDMWAWVCGPVNPMQTVDDGKDVQLTTSDGKFVAPRHQLVAVFDRDGSSVIERRQVIRGSKLCRVSWLIGAPAVPALVNV